MTSPAFEAFLARLYVDGEFRRAFLQAPDETARGSGLSPCERKALESIDRVGLEMAAESYARKRQVKGK